MDIHFTCHNCGQPLSVDDEGAGLDVPCPGCGKEVTVPKRSEPPKQQSAPARPAASKLGVSPPAPPHAGPPPRSAAAPRSFQGVSSGQGTAIIVLLVAGLFVIPFFRSTFNLVATPAHWEYKITSFPDYSLDRKINEYGADGWELVFARRASDGGEYVQRFSYEMIFKRPKRL